MVALDKRTRQAFELMALVLHECSVTRGDGDPNEPGKVQTSIEVEGGLDDERDAIYVVGTKNIFSDAAGDVICEIDAKFAAVYAVDPAHPLTPEQMRSYGEGPATTHVIPFMREFLATMTNRLGLAPFYMPIHRARRFGPDADSDGPQAAPPIFEPNDVPDRGQAKAEPTQGRARTRRSRTTT